MGPHLPLEDVLAARPRCVREQQGVLFSSLCYRPSDEQISLGFRCFAVDGEALLDAFLRRDFAGLEGLAPALDAEGQPTVSGVRLDIARVPSGRLVGVQPVGYTEDYVPTPAAPAVVLDGEDALALAALMRRLDQHSPV